MLEEFIAKPPCNLLIDDDQSKDCKNAKHLLTLIIRGHKYFTLSYDQLLFKVLSYDAVEKLRVG